MGSMVLVILGVGPILGNGLGFKNKIVLHSFREKKCHQCYTSGLCYHVYNVLGYWYWYQWAIGLM